jgi:hypothetical protein
MGAMGTIASLFLAIRLLRAVYRSGDLGKK